MDFVCRKCDSCIFNCGDFCSIHSKSLYGKTETPNFCEDGDYEPIEE